MSDDDLIRRMDAIRACQVGPSDEWSKSTKDGYNQAATDCAMNILRISALPAAAPVGHWKDVCRDSNGPDICDEPCSKCLAALAPAQPAPDAPALDADAVVALVEAATEATKHINAEGEGTVLIVHMKRLVAALARIKGGAA